MPKTLDFNLLEVNLIFARKIIKFVLSNNYVVETSVQKAGIIQFQVMFDA